MPYYNEQPRQGYYRSPSPPLSHSHSYVASNAGKNNYNPYRTNDRYDYTSRHDRSPRSDASSSPSYSPSPNSRTRNSTKQSQRRDTIAKAGIVVGAFAVLAGALHLYSNRERRRAERQAAVQRERRITAAKREKRRRKEEEEDRRAEEEERRRDEYDEWRERGRRGFYIEGPPRAGSAASREGRGSVLSREGRGAR